MGMVPPAALAAVGVLLGLLVRHSVLARFERRARLTPSQLDDILVHTLSGPTVLWGLIAGMAVAIKTAAPAPELERLLLRSLVALLIVSFTWALARLAGGMVRRYAITSLGLLPSATLVTNLTRVLVYTVGALVLLQTLGVSVTPVLTALGVGGLAVALALQDTLANLFAGVHLLVSRQVRPGDFVELDTGQRGFVQDVTWRYTTIRQLPNNLTVVPNAKLASAITTNYDLPSSDLAVLVEVGVAYGSDLARVERVTIEVASEVMRAVEGGVPDFEPLVRYHTFAESSVNFTVIMRGQRYDSQFLIKHEFIKRLHQRYGREGIEIPFPIRTVHLGGKAGEAGH
jgi:small-conductance mechanosensitive channel